MMSLVEIGAIGGAASPFVVGVGLLAQAIIHWRRQAQTAAKAEQVLQHADENLAAGLKDLRRTFDAAISEFRVSNERNAKHEVDCAERWGATGVRLDRVEEAVQWGTRRIEELFRGQAALAHGHPPPAPEPAPDDAPLRRPRRKSTQPLVLGA